MSQWIIHLARYMLVLILHPYVAQAESQTLHVAKLAWISTASDSQVQGFQVCSTIFSIYGKH